MSTVNRRNVLRGAAMGVVAQSLPLGARAQAALDLATAYPAGNFHVQNLRQMADDLAQPAAGGLTLRIHPGGSLIKAAGIREAVEAGQVAVGEVFGPSLSALNGAFALDAVPFLATNYTLARKLWTTLQPKVEALLRERGLVLLLSVPWPPQGLFSNVPLTVASDLEGLRMRENSPPVRRLAELARTQPVRVETPELAAAAAERKIDLVFTSAAQGLETQLHEAMPYYYEANAWLPRNLVFMHRASHERLPAAQRQAFTRAAKAAEERGWSASTAFARSSTEVLIKTRGVKHSPLSPNVRVHLDRLGNQIARETLRAGGTDLLALAGSFLR